MMSVKKSNAQYRMADDKVIRILTNHWGQKASPTWRAFTTYLPPEGFDLVSSLKLALRLYMRRNDFDCVVLGAGFSDTLFGLMQSLLPFRKVPCVVIDCLWHKDPSDFRRTLKKMILTIAGRTVSRFVVWATREVEAFSETFGLPRAKFVFVPYHTTFVEWSNIQPYEGDYIFSGGNSDRDYDTLIKAVRGLPIKLFIATNDSRYLSLTTPENVEIKGCGEEEYIQKMAGCRINVVPLAPGLLRSAGQQTFLNSMWYGKATIVTDPEGASDYINHGEDGLLVPHKNPTVLREAIEFLLGHPEKRKEMGIKAAQKAKSFSTEAHFKRIVSLAYEVSRRR